MESCKEKKADLEVERAKIELQESVELGEINRSDIEEAVRNLKETLEHATREELKELLRENIKEIRIPNAGTARLEANPAGLLSRCIVLVTPRGAAMEATTLMFCGMPLLVVVQQPTLFLRFYDSTYHRQHQH